jgi:hypothetical protein
MLFAQLEEDMYSCNPWPTAALKAAYCEIYKLNSLDLSHHLSPGIGFAGNVVGFHFFFAQVSELLAARVAATESVVYRGSRRRSRSTRCSSGRSGSIRSSGSEQY